MKKYKKTYAIHNLAEKHTTFHLGKTKVHVSFTGGQVTKKGVNPATFTTEDPIVQLAIEKSKAFADGAVILLAKYPMPGEVKIGMNPRKPKTDLIREAAENAANPIQEEAPIDKPEDNPEPTPEPTPEPATETAEASAQEEETVEEQAEQEDPGVSNLEVVEVSCRDVAKQYLQEHFGENPAPLRTIANIQECAAKYGITFNFV